MKGINYWRVREQAALERYLAEETDYEARLEEIYKTAADNIEKEIQSLLSKYAATENITMADARKRADRMDVEAFSRKAARYVKEKNFSEKANRELKLYNLKMKISRLELLKKNIELELIAAADEAERELRSELEKRARDELKRQAGILGGGAENVAEAAKAIAAGTFYGETFSSRLWTNTEAMNKKLSALLSSGLIRGQNPRVLARSIRDQYIGPERLKNGRRGAVYAAERLMRTELARVQTEAQMRSFEANGIEEYEFIAASNCCDVCAELNGKYFEVKGISPGGNAPPMHPHCRCSCAPAVLGDAKEIDIDGERSIIQVGRSLGAAAKKYNVKLPGSKDHGFLLEGQNIVGHIFAGNGTDSELRDRYYLEANYHIPANEWQKVAGNGKVVLARHEIRYAELHWYEARGIREDFKVKRYLDKEEVNNDES